MKRLDWLKCWLAAKVAPYLNIPDDTEADIPQWKFMIGSYASCYHFCSGHGGYDCFEENVEIKRTR